MTKIFYLVLLFCLFVMNLGYSQTYSKSQIDSLLADIHTYGDSIPLTVVAKGRESYRHSEKIGYVKGMVISSLFIAKNLVETHEYDQALEQNQKSENAALSLGDFELLSELYRLNGVSYIGLGLFDQGANELRKGLNYTDLIPDSDTTLKQKGLLFKDLAMGYCKSGKQLDIVLKYFMLSHNYFNKIKDPKAKLAALSLSNTNIGYCFLEMKQFNPASAYLTNAYYIGEQESHAITRLYTYINLGRVKIEQNQFNEGIDYLEKSVLLAKRLKKQEVLCDSYLNLSKAYKKFGDWNKEDFYYDKYLFLTDSLQKVQKSATIKTINGLVAQKDYKDFNLKRKWLIGLSFIVFITLIIGFRASRIYLRKKREDRRIAEKRQKLLDDNEILDQVNTQNSTNVVEVVNLAMMNDSDFLEVFKQNHLDFYDRFIQSFPDLNENEIKICAFLKLGFHVKDIAIYTDVTVRSVESRIYRIRKKIKLSVNEDMSLWILRF